MKQDMRASALRELEKEWAHAIEAGLEIGRVFERLLRAQQHCHEHGLHTTVVFDDELTQRAWAEFRRMHGDMIPLHLEEAPPMMRHEDTTIEEVTGHGN
jgi:hypothetical protein